VIVLDSSALVDLLIGNEPAATFVAGELRRADSLSAPCVLDAEVVGALRRLEANGALEADACPAALEALLELDVERYPLGDLVHRVWTLRRHVAPADAFFVALAEALEAPLVTTDPRLARAHGHEAVVVTP
jgi:predicted nucleic acid-binding protein